MLGVAPAVCTAYIQWSAYRRKCRTVCIWLMNGIAKDFRMFLDCCVWHHCVHVLLSVQCVFFLIRLCLTFWFTCSSCDYAPWTTIYDHPETAISCCRERVVRSVTDCWLSLSPHLSFKITFRMNWYRSIWPLTSNGIWSFVFRVAHNNN